MEKEKRDFIVKKGMLGVGLPVALLMSLSAAFQVPGYLFKLQAFNPRTFVISVLIFTPIFLSAGWVWGYVVYGLMQKKKR